MKRCIHCLEPDTRPGAIFDEEGICMACRYSMSIPRVDWDERRTELKSICDWARANTKSHYDCIIPVSGGKDSTRQALYMRDEMGMHPLLVTCAYPPRQQTDRGAHNMGNLIELGFDAHYIGPSPETSRRLTCFTFFEFGNIFKASELALYSTAPKEAIALGIPLLIYGENGALQWGGTVFSNSGDGNRQKYMNTLQGGDLSPYLGAGFVEEDLFWYRYPSDDEMDLHNQRLIYLGYFIPDFNDETNAKVAMANGLEVRMGNDADPVQTGSVTEYDALDDDFVMVNQMLKYLKFGFGKATQQLSGFIRTGRMTRQEAVEIACDVDGQCAPRYIRNFCDYIEISEDQFWERANKLREPDVWEEVGNSWRLKNPLQDV